MALGESLRRFAGGFSGSNIAQQMMIGDREQEQARVERLIQARRTVPDGSREARAIDERLIELAPEMAMETPSRPTVNEEGFIQHEPGGVTSTVTEDPESAAQRAKSERAQRLRRSAAAQIARMQRLPEELRQGMAQQAMASEDPEKVLKEAREYGRLNVKSSEGAFSEQLRERTGNGNFVAVRTPEGIKRQTTDEQGNIRLVSPPSDFQLVDTSVQGSPDEVLPSGENTSLRDQQVATMNFVDTTRDALSLLQDSPDVNTFAARGASLINDLQQEGKALARASGLEFEEDSLDPSKYEDTFDELGIQNERMKSMFVSLAFQAATASGQTGRSVSDKDIRRFMQQVGAQSADPRAISRTLIDLAERTVNSFKNSYRVRREEDFQGDLGLSTLPTIGGGEQGGTVDFSELPE